MYRIGNPSPSQPTINGTSSRIVYVVGTAFAAYDGNSQTTFPFNYDPYFVDVYLNGTKLIANEDYDASSGTEIVLTTSAPVGAYLNFVGYGTFTIADALMASNNLTDLTDVSVAQNALELKSAAYVDIIGTVSQSGGVPTGAIIESDSNSDGEWTRFADGTQIVTHVSSTTLTTTNSHGSVYFANESGIVFAQSFISNPLITPISFQISGITWGSQYGVSTTQTGIRVMATADTAEGIPALIAIGRWF